MMDEDERKLAQFNERMHDWLASQGIVFHLIHGGKAVWFRCLKRLLARIVVCCLLMAGALAFYLHKRVEQDGFREDLQNAARVFFHAGDFAIPGMKRSRGGLLLKDLKATGGEQAFFESLEAGQVAFRMGLLDGVPGSLGKWQAGILRVGKLDLRLKAGASPESAARASFASLFEKSGRFNFEGIEVYDGTIQWGYTEATKGRIKGSRISILPLAGKGWKVSIRGGTFTQNWLRDLEIKEIQAEVHPGGVFITKALLKSGKEGRLEFSLAIAGGGGRPLVAGKGKAKALDLRHCLPREALVYLGGRFSGDFVISGSTNSLGGIAMEWKAKLGKGDRIVLRNDLPLLKALALFDPRKGRYKKVVFEKGAFRFRSGGEGMELEKVALQAEGLLRLEGRMTARLPTAKEVHEALGIGFWEKREPFPGIASNKAAAAEDLLTLEKAGKASTGEDGTPSGKTSPPSRRKREKLWMKEEQEMRVFRADGRLRVAVLPEALSRYQKLEKLYPLDERGEWRWIDVPLKGAKLGKITSDTVDLLYKQTQGILVPRS